MDAAGNLYVADDSNNRVLEYNTPLTTDTTAERVFGTCGSFTSSACAGLSANSLDEPKGVAVDASGNLYVADIGNSRVLQYDQPLVTPTPTATATATATQTATATATPTPVPASLEVSPNTLHFPTTVLGSTSKPGKVKLLNPRNSKRDSPILIISAVPTHAIQHRHCAQHLSRRDGAGAQERLLLLPDLHRQRAGHTATEPLR